VLWDEDSLYVAAECTAPAGVTAVLSRRDRTSEGDKIEFNLDTTLDRFNISRTISKRREDNVWSGDCFGERACKTNQPTKENVRGQRRTCDRHE
jgi:hypothetical protein